MPPIYWQLMQTNTATALAQIEADGGKRPSMGNMGTSWWGGGTYPTGAYNTVGAGSAVRSFLTTVRNNGMIPWVDWYSDLAGDPSFALKKIYIDGIHDAFIAQWAQDMAAFGHPVFVRFNGEMNGSWRTSFYERNGFGPAGRTNAAGDFVLMWKHVLDIIRSNGATNLTWIWCPNFQPPAPTVTYASIFPGAAYVDWLGVDCYNFAGNAAGGGNNQPWMTFTQLLRGFTGWLGDTWTELTALDPSLPIVIGEHGCDPREGTDTNASAATVSVWNGQKKGDWFTDELNVQLPGNGTTDFRRIRAISYFNTTDDGRSPPITGGFASTNGDWPIEDPTASSGKTGGGIPQTSWQAQTGINSAYFVRGGQFALPSGMQKAYPYEGVPQLCRFDNLILATAQGKLQGFWKENETSGTAGNDSSGNARNGTYTGGFTLGQPRLSVGFPDTCVLYNGSTGYLTVPTNAAFSLANTGKLTIVALFNISTTPVSFYTIAGVAGGSGYSWALRIDSSLRVEGIAWDLSGGTYSTASIGPISLNTTYLAVWTIDTSRTPHGRIGWAAVGASSISNYVTSSDFVATPGVSTGTLDIGRRPDNSGYFSGLISRAALFSDIISDVSANEFLVALSSRRRRIIVG